MVSGPGIGGFDLAEPESVESPPDDHRERVEEHGAGPTPTDRPDSAPPVREILVVDVCGVEVARAEISRVSGGSGEALGLTGSHGLLRLVSEARSTDGWSVELFGDSLPIAEVRHDAGVLGRTRITVQFRDQIWGQVNRDDFGPDDGATVCAWKKGTVSPLDAIGEGSHPFLAEVDRTGRFSICGLEAGQDYYLVAAGRGRASELIKQATAGYVHRTRFTTEEVFGAHVRFVDPEGEPARINSKLTHFGGFGWKRTGNDPNPLRSDLPQAALLGVPAEDLALVPGDFLWLQYGQPRDEDPEFRFDFPGYEPMTDSVEVAPILGGIQDYACVLRPTCDGFGGLELHITPEPTYARGIPSQLHFSPLELDLRPELPGRSVQLAIHGDASSPWVVEGIPAGEYFANFRASHNHLRWPTDRKDPAYRVSIVPDQRSALRVNWPELGAVVLKLSKGGEPYTDHAMLSLYRPVRSEALGLPGDKIWTGGIVSFEGPPYCFDFVPPGEYRASVLSPQVDGERQIEFTLLDARVLEFEFEID